MPLNVKGRILSPLLHLIEYWALLGGLILVALVLMATFSSVAGYLIARPFPGDFEVMEMGMAVAAFMFLPYCQVSFAHVSADVFTANASAATVRLLSRLASALALVFTTILMWRMYAGLLDYQTYVEVTAILEIPLWFAFVPALISLGLWFMAALITFIVPEGSDESLDSQATN